MSFSLPKWLTRNRGKAARSFSHAVTAAPACPAPRPARIPVNIAKSAPGLQDGPKPPTPLYAAAKRAEFNANWRAEYRAALAAQNSRNAAHQFQQVSGQSMSL